MSYGVSATAALVRKRYFPWLALLFSGAATACLYLLNSYLHLPLAVSVVLGTFLFLVFHNENRSVAAAAFERRPVRLKAYLVAYFVCLALSVFLAVNSHHPPGYEFYLSIALLSALLLCVLTHARTSVGCVLFLVSAGWLFLWPQVVFPNGFGGQDSYYHVSQVIRPIIEHGSVPPQTNYTYFPGHHVLVSVLSLVLDTSARRTYYFTTASVLAILSLFVYAFARLFSVDLLGRTYVTPEIAVVVYLSSSFVLRYAYQGNHLPYAIFFLMIILYLTYRVLFWSDTDSYAMYVLLLLAYLSLIVTHHYTTAMGLLLVLVLFVTSRSRRVLLVTFAAGVFTLLHWGWIADVNGLDLVVTNVVPLFRDFGFSDPTSASTDQPLSVLLYTTIGTALVLLFAQIGLLLGIRSSRVQTVSLVTVCYFLLGLIGVGVIVGTEGLSPNRIFFISQVLFLPALCASGIVLLGSRRILLFGTVTIVLVSALTVAGPAPAFETAILGNDVPNSKTFQTTNERAAIEWYDDVGDTDDRVYTSRSYVDFRTGTAMFRPHLEESTVDARMIPVADDEYNKTDIEDDEIYFHTIYDKEIGYRPELESSRRVGQAETTQISDRSVDEIRTRNDNVYSNQVVEVYK